MMTQHYINLVTDPDGTVCYWHWDEIMRGYRFTMDTPVSTDHPAGLRYQTSAYHEINPRWEELLRSARAHHPDKFVATSIGCLTLPASFNAGEWAITETDGDK